jgi:hypothetical protein
MLPFPRRFHHHAWMSEARRKRPLSLQRAAVIAFYLRSAPRNIIVFD